MRKTICPILSSIITIQQKNLSDSGDQAVRYVQCLESCEWFISADQPEDEGCSVRVLLSALTNFPYRDTETPHAP